MARARTLAALALLAGIPACSLVFGGGEHQANLDRDAGSGVDAALIDDAGGRDDAGGSDDGGRVEPDAGTSTTRVTVRVGDGPPAATGLALPRPDVQVLAHHPDGSMFGVGRTGADGEVVVDVPVGGMITVEEGLEGFPTTVFDVPDGALIEIRVEGAVGPDDVPVTAAITGAICILSTGCEAVTVTTTGGTEPSARLAVGPECASVSSGQHIALSQCVDGAGASSWGTEVFVAAATEVRVGLPSVLDAPEVWLDTVPAGVTTQFGFRAHVGYRRLYETQLSGVPMAGGAAAMVPTLAAGDVVSVSASLSYGDASSQSIERFADPTTSGIAAALALFRASDLLPRVTSVSADADTARPTLSWTIPATMPAHTHQVVALGNWRAIAPAGRTSVRYPEVPTVFGMGAVHTLFGFVRLVDDTGLRGTDGMPDYEAVLLHHSRPVVPGTVIRTAQAQLLPTP